MFYFKGIDLLDITHQTFHSLWLRAMRTLWSRQLLVSMHSTCMTARISIWYICLSSFMKKFAILKPVLMDISIQLCKMRKTKVKLCAGKKCIKLCNSKVIPRKSSSSSQLVSLFSHWLKRASSSSLIE